MGTLRNIAAQIESGAEVFEKIAGIHQGPPQLYKDTFRFVAEKYAGHVWAQALDRYKIATPQRKKELKELIDYVSQFADKPREYRSFIKTVMPIKVDGWTPYESLIDQGKKLSDWHKKITLTLNFKGHVRRLGQAGHGEIEIDVTYVPENLNGFKQSLQRLKRTIRHEVAHIGQYIISSMIHKGREGGMPSKKIRTEMTPAIKRLQRSDKERLKDVEFYTYLGDAVDEFKFKAKNLPPDKKKELAYYTVALRAFNPIRRNIDAALFFQNIRRHAPDKWKKAVKEFFKAIAPIMEDIPGGEIPGEMVEGRWSQSKLMQMINQYNAEIAKDPNSPEANRLLALLRNQETLYHGT